MDDQLHFQPCGVDTPLNKIEVSWVDIALENRGVCGAKDFQNHWHKLDKLRPDCIRRMYLM